MRKVIVFVVLSAVLAGLLVVAGVTGTLQAQERIDASVKGAGATFPEPIYVRWAAKFGELTGMQIDYAGIGSSGGIKNIRARTVDFGGSDEPQKPADLEQWGLIQFPMVIGGVVPIVNVPGIKAGELKLTGKVLADIYMGRIAKWNDPAIAALNPGVKLPGSEITPVVRADGSGTTWIFTNYLCKVSPDFARRVGNDKKPGWEFLAGKGNAGVAANVQKIRGTIGYVEYAYALVNKLTYAKLQNKAGNFVAPKAENFAAAAAGADWAGAKDYYVILTDQPGDKTWPIVGATFILFYKDQADAAKARAILKFLDWCYRHGGPDALKLNYVPIPPKVYGLVEKTWSKELKSGGKPLWE